MDRSLAVASPVLAPLPDVGQAAQAAGLHRVWTTEFSGRDALIRSLALGMSTSTLHVGTGIAYAFTRAPRTVAAAALDIAEFTGGRFTLGLGAGTRGLRRSYGVEDFEPPSTRLVEVVGQIRSTWAEAAWARSVAPPQIAIAGVNSIMLRDAAEHGDRVVMHPLCLVQGHLADRVVPALAEGGQRRGNGRARLSAWCITAIDASADVAQAQARRQLAFYASTPGYRTVFEGGPFEEQIAQLRDEFRLEPTPDFSTLSALIPDELLAEVAVWGTPDSINSAVARMEERLAALDVDEIVFQTVSSDDDERGMRAIISSLGPARWDNR